MVRRRIALASLAVGIGAVAPAASAVSVIDLKSAPGGATRVTGMFSASDQGAPMLQSAGLDHAMFLTAGNGVTVSASPIVVTFGEALPSVSGDIAGASADNRWLVQARNLGGVVVSDTTVGGATADASGEWSLVDGTADIASVTFSLLPNTPASPPVVIVSTGGGPKVGPGTAPAPQPVPIPPMAIPAAYVLGGMVIGGKIHRARRRKAATT